MDKTGILYICTGKYEVFWETFYRSVNEYFLNDTEKHIFVWTDSAKIFEEAKSNDKIHCYEQETEPWPYPTLKRFSYFLRAEDELKKMDYLLFMNGNLRVNRRIDADEILPMGKEELFVTMHPGFYASAPTEFTYDNDPECHAYIPKGEGRHYFAGGFNGGRTQPYLELVRELAWRIDDDLSRGKIALWHDESQINRYMNDTEEDRYRILSPAYLYPEGWDIPFEEKITVLEKGKKGGHEYLRS